MNTAYYGYPGVPAAAPAYSPLIGAQAGAEDLLIQPGAAAYPAANATVYRVYEYAVPVTTVATAPSVAPIGAAAPIAAGIPGQYGYPGAVPAAYGYPGAV